jgi:hypothetical protein
MTLDLPPASSTAHLIWSTFSISLARAASITSSSVSRSLRMLRSIGFPFSMMIRGSP